MEVMNNDIYPKYYFCRGGTSDLNWILIRLAHIPADQKKKVCDEYEHIYLSNKTGRKMANTYLQGVAKEYRLLASRKGE